MTTLQHGRFAQRPRRGRLCDRSATRIHAPLEPRPKPVFLLVLSDPPLHPHTALQPPLHPAEGHEKLTRREHEVAVLVARGLSNREVAEHLVITEKTAKNHVQRLLEKLGFRSRCQVIARAQELGLRD